MSQKIELQKVRDFGELITDTFVFVRQNLKQLLACFFIFCGFFLLAYTVFAALQQIKVATTVNSAFHDPNLYQPTSIFGSERFAFFGIEYALSMVMLMLGYVAMHVTIYSYMCIYREKGNETPTTEEVWGYFKYFFFKVLGSGILLTVLISFASLLCLVPGIYLWPIFGLVIPIMVFENTSFGYAFNRSFRLIKNNWWTTFGALFVMGLIVYVISFVIVMPAAAVNMVNLFLHAAKGTHLSIVTSILTAILGGIAHIFYILPMVLVSLCYFSLTEQMDSTGLMGRIDQLGKTGPDNTSHLEEY
jgi:hypothetical protein